MRILCLAVVAALGILAVSCSKKPGADSSGKPANSKEATQELAAAEAEKDSKEPERESEGLLEPDEIGEDCVAFLRATRAVPANPRNGVCPTCSPNDTSPEVLKFDSFEVGPITPSQGAFAVDVTIHAHFNPSSGGTITGGLVGWISPEQRKQYSLGKAPTGPQVYKVRVTYRRPEGVWRPIDFDRAN